MRIRDPLTDYIVSKLDIPSILKSYFPDWMDVCPKVRCPWHDETKPSLVLYEEDGGAHCFGCGEHLNNIVELVAKLEALSIPEAQDMLYRQIHKTLPIDSVTAMHHQLWLHDKPLDWLRTERNLTDQTIKKFRLGYDVKSWRITIPVLDRFGHCVNIRKYAWLEEQLKDGKMLNVTGHGDNRLFPEADAYLSRKLVIVEGEMDCMVAKQFGLPAITATCGVNSWNEEFTEILKGKALWILFDADKAGQDAAMTLWTKLTLCQLDSLVKIVPGWSKGKDITDWSFTQPQKLWDLAEQVKDFKFAAPKQKCCPTCHRPL